MNNFKMNQKMRRLLFCHSLLALSALLFCANADNLSLNGTWQFFHAKTAEQADSLQATGFPDAEYQGLGFQDTPVPSNWAILGYEEPMYRGFKDDKASEGFYRYRFQVTGKMAKQRNLLHFDGVWASAEVWLNGERLGRHDSGYTSFAMDASKAIKEGENVLAVRVRQVYPGYKTDTYDDWTLGGIYRDVWLESMPSKRWIERVRVQTKQNGEVNVRIMVADTHKNTLPGNYRSPGKPYALQISLTDKDGKEIIARKVAVQAHTSTGREINEMLAVKDAHLWSAETPYLYSLRVSLLEKDSVAQTYTQKIGIREVSTKDGVLRVNGQAIKLRGVNRHDEYPDVGRATTRKHWLEDLRLMKAANINYIRACHYQHAKGFIEMCDSMGMYVGAEISLGGASDLMYDPNFISSALLRTAETVERDINNPSIIYWSVGNEDSFTDMFLQCVRTAKGLDPTRPVLFPWNADETLPEEIDILAPHYWTAAQYDSIASQSKRPIITTEYVHAYGTQRFGGLADCWKMLTKHPAGAGGAVWMWADQGLKTPTKKDPKQYRSLGKEDDYLRLNSAGWDGITDSYRHPTRDFEEVKAVYLPVYPDVEQTALSSNLQIPIRNGYDFTDLNAVQIQWQLFVDGQLKDKGDASLSAAPHATAMLSVPTGKLGNIKAGQTAYVRCSFSQKGELLGQRFVEILTPETAQQGVKGKAQWTVNPATGLPDGIRPTIWHKLNDGDQIIKNRSFAKGAQPEKFTTKVLSFEAETKEGKTIARSQVAYAIDAANSFDASYVCTVEGNRLTVDYELTPRLQTSYIPVVGLAVQMKSSTSLKHWFGLGPGEAFPNKKVAETLGLWNAKGMEGTRAMRWAEYDNVRVSCDGYLDRDDKESTEIRILSEVLGRSEKGRLNDARYHVKSGKTYKGHVVFLKQ